MFPTPTTTAIDVHDAVYRPETYMSDATRSVDSEDTHHHKFPIGVYFMEPPARPRIPALEQFLEMRAERSCQKISLGH